MKERQRPYYDPSILQAERARRAEQLRQDIKRAFGFGKCKIVENPLEKKP